MYAEQESLWSFLERFNTNSICFFSRQIANCSTLEELQYEKHFHQDGDDCGK